MNCILPLHRKPSFCHYYNYYVAWFTFLLRKPFPVLICNSINFTINKSLVMQRYFATIIQNLELRCLWMTRVIWNITLFSFQNYVRKNSFHWRNSSYSFLTRYIQKAKKTISFTCPCCCQVWRLFSNIQNIPRIFNIIASKRVKA